MLKHLMLFSFTIIVSVTSFCQSEPSNDEKIIGKYTIKVKPNEDATFGYEVFDSEKLLIKKPYKPFILTQVGFKKKENVLLIAEWHIKQFMETGKTHISLSPKRAKELGVSEEDL